MDRTPLSWMNRVDAPCAIARCATALCAAALHTTAHCAVVAICAAALCGRALLPAYSAELTDKWNLLSTQAKLATDANKLELAEQLYRQAQKAAEGLPPCDKRVSRSRENLGCTLLSESKYVEAQREFKECLANRLQCFGEDSALVAVALQRLGDALRWSKDTAAAGQCYKREIGILEHVYGPSHLSLSRPLQRLAESLESQGDHNSAQKVLARSIAIRESSMGADNPDLVEDLCLLSRWYLGQQKFDDCLRVARQALTISNTAFGTSNKRNLDALLPLTAAYIALGKYDLAEAPARQAVSIANKNMPASNRLTREVEQHLVRILDAQGQASEAELMHKKILSGLALTAEDELPFAAYLAGRAENFEARHKYDQAASFYEQAISHLGNRAVLTRIVWLNKLALCQVEKKDLFAAEKTCRTRLSVIESVGAGNGDEARKTLLLLASILEKQGRYSEASAIKKRVEAPRTGELQR